MTKPKKRVGNPLGESKLSKDEQASWAEMNHFAKLLKQSATKLVDYTEGRGGSPDGYACLMYAIRMYTAQETAMGLRKGRRG